MNRNTIIVIGLGAGIGYALLNRNRRMALPSSSNSQTAVASSAPQLSTAQASAFPLRVGSREKELVKGLQQALINKGGSPAKIILDSGGADGIFGRGTARALKAAGFSESVSKSDYELILGIATKSIASSSFNASAVSSMARRYYQSIFSNADDAVRFLTLISSPREYLAVSDRVKQWSGGKSLLEVVFERLTFGKDRVRNEFTRMGLVQNSNGSWSVPTLGGLGQMVRNVMATMPTEYKDIEGTTYYTNARNILGVFMRSHKGVTYFEQNGKIYGIPSTHVIKI